MYLPSPRGLCPAPDSPDALQPQPPRQVLVFTDWDALPDPLGTAASGMAVDLRPEREVPQALASAAGQGTGLEAVVLDTDHFGSPEEGADFCFALRRLAPWVRILVIESEICEEEDALKTLGACDVSLPSPACPWHIHAKLMAGERPN